MVYSLLSLVFIWYSWGLDSNVASAVCASNGCGCTTTVVLCISTLLSGWMEDGWTYLWFFLTMEAAAPLSIPSAGYSTTDPRLWIHKIKAALNRGNGGCFLVLNYSITMLMLYALCVQHMKAVKRLFREWIFPTLSTVVAPPYSYMSVILLNNTDITENSVDALPLPYWNAISHGCVLLASHVHSICCKWNRGKARDMKYSYDDDCGQNGIPIWITAAYVGVMSH